MRHEFQKTLLRRGECVMDDKNGVLDWFYRSLGQRHFDDAWFRKAKLVSKMRLSKNTEWLSIMSDIYDRILDTNDETSLGHDSALYVESINADGDDNFVVRVKFGYIGKVGMHVTVELRLECDRWEIVGIRGGVTYGDYVLDGSASDSRSTNGGWAIPTYTCANTHTYVNTNTYSMNSDLCASSPSRYVMINSSEMFVDNYDCV